MYELALGIDVREMANSRFHQTQREAAGLNCQMSFLFFFTLLWSCHVFAVWVKKPQSEKKTAGSFRLLGARLFLSDGDISNPLMSRLKGSQRQKGLEILFPFLAGGVLYPTLFGLF